ncbi:D-alanyl-D-alanine endopeptidase [Photobacterium japonica]|uniref:D-alanyl-D-alanine endopeptidase n=1 Tax=Photobacterium japonica TaxID=2910235 RepID=UPI003D133D64
MIRPLSTLLLLVVSATSFTTLASNIETASVSAYVSELKSGDVVYQKNADVVMPIASLTKVMTAIVVLDAKLPLKEPLTFDTTDKERIYNGYSRIRMQSQLTRGEALRIALMSSENLASAALADNYPGGHTEFVKAMNKKAKQLSMTHTHFVDSSGLSPDNVSTATDVHKMIVAASKYPDIKKYSTTVVHTAYFKKPRYKLGYTNTNALVRGNKWDITLSKTGYLDIAGHCLAMIANINKQDYVMVTLDAYGKRTPLGDASRIKKWITTGDSGDISDSAEHYQRTKLSALAQ